MNINKILLCVGISLFGQIAVGMDEAVEERSMVVEGVLHGKWQSTSPQMMEFVLRKQDDAPSGKKVIFTTNTDEGKVGFEIIKAYAQNKQPKSKGYGRVVDLAAINYLLSEENLKEKTVDVYLLNETDKRCQMVFRGKLCANLNHEKKPLEPVSSFAFPSLKLVLGTATGLALFVASILLIKHYQK